MLPLFLFATVLTADTTVYASETTRLLVERAITRHAAQDQGVVDYTARFRYRLSFGLGRRRWAEVPNAAVEEQEGTVRWAQPNDLQVSIQGRRSVARSSNFRLDSSFDQPWFFPRGLSDSIRVFGNEVPPRAALHPLAGTGPEWYRYRITDSVQASTPEGRRVKLIAVEVLPRRTGPALVAGRLWFDAAEADLVRFTFRFVGTELWLDPDDTDADDARINRIVSRILTLDADLEYALQGERHWMPYRQVVSGRVELPWLGELVVPFEARTTFDDYEVNTGRPIVFTLPLPPEPSDSAGRARFEQQRDSLRRARRERTEEVPEDSLARDEAGRWQNGRFEIHRAPADSLAGYGRWGDSLVLADDAATDRTLREVQSDLERMAADLPPALTGRRTHGFLWERIPELVRMNRVQGLAPGLGYEWTLPGDGFTTLRADGRFGLSDHRLVGGITVVREAPGARWTLRGHRDLASNDPFGRGNAFGNSLNAIFAGHDDADYHLVHGGTLRREGSLGTGVELTTTLRVEHQQGVRREAQNWLNDALGGTGRYPGNPPIAEGTFGGAEVRLDGGLGRSRWIVAADVLASDTRGTARLYGSLRRGLWAGRAVPVLSLRAGLTTDDPLPQQAFRLGGQQTVRGFDYGTRRGQAMWAAQVDWPLRRGVVQPFAFVDAGQAARAADLFGSRVLAGGGLGLGFLGGLVRFDLSHPISTGGDGLRFDLAVRGLF